jgi:hypothetical protein
MIIFGGPLAALAQTSPPAPKSAASIGQWVKALESDTYSARHAATERLILAGGVAVEPVAAAIEDGGLETIIRGVYILRQLALTTDDASTEQAAYEALRKIADRQVTTAARRAATAVQALDEIRQRRALLYLEQLGAVVSITQVQIGPRLSQPFSSIRIDESWRGNAADLDRLGWITKFRPPEGPEMWMIALQGPQVTDAWIQRIKPFENIRVLQLKSVAISDEGVAALKEMPELQFLEFLYLPITDAALPHLSSLKALSRVKLYGTRITKAAVEQFQGQFAGVEVDYRRGGFLGIGCEDNPCRISTVREGTAAAAADLQAGDIVTHYNQQPVKTMDELTELIAQNAAGDTVRVEILRDGQRIEKELILGEWE